MSGSIQGLLSHTATQNLSWTLVHFVWQGAALALVVALVLLLLRRQSPNARYAVCCGALLIMAMCPVTTFYFLSSHASDDGPRNAPGRVAQQVENVHEPPGESVVVATEPHKKSDDAGTPANNPLRPAANEPPSPADPVRSEFHSTVSDNRTMWQAKLFPWFVVAWLTGVVLLSAWHVVGWSLSQRLRRLGVSDPGHAIQSMVDRLAEKLGVVRRVVVRQSGRVGAPTLIGWIRPTLLAPAHILTGLSSSELEAILAHELAHVRRHDYLLNVFQAIVETALFYHPAVWWLSRRIRIEREFCADDLATRYCGTPESYARALATLGGLTLAPPHLAVSSTGGQLMARVRRLLGQPPERPNFARACRSWLPVAVLVLVVAGMLVCGRVPPESNVAADDAPIKGDNEHAVAEEEVDTSESPGALPLDHVRSIAEWVEDLRPGMSPGEVRAVLGLADSKFELSGAGSGPQNDHRTTIHLRPTEGYNLALVYDLTKGRVLKRASLVGAGWGDKRAVRRKTGLEFRIVPNRLGSSRAPAVSPFAGDGTTKPATDDLEMHGPWASRRRNAEFQWFETKVDLAAKSINAKYKKGDYVLLCGRDNFVMLDDGSWRIKRVAATIDDSGDSALSFELDEIGGKMLRELTSNNMHNRLAILVDGRVVSALTIRGEIGASGMISGDFSKEDVQQLFASLSRGVPTNDQPKENDGAAKTDRQFDEFVKGTQDANMFVRERSLRSLERLREPRCVPILIGLLKNDPKRQIRQGAAYALQYFPGDKTVSALTDVLKDDQWVAASAAYSLGALQAEVAIKPTYDLIWAIKNDEFAERAVLGLRQHRNKKVVPLLIDVLEKVADARPQFAERISSGVNVELLGYARHTTKQLGPAPETVEQWRDWWSRAEPLFTANMTLKPIEAAPLIADKFEEDATQVSLTASLDAMTFRQGDPIRLDLAFKNNSKLPIRTILPNVPSGWWPTMAFGVKLQRTDGTKDVVIDFEPSDFYLGSYSGPPSFEAFRSGQTFKDSICLQYWLGNERVWPLDEGSYVLTIQFDSSKFAGVRPKETEVVHRWTADPVHFTVAGKPREDPDELLRLISKKSGLKWLASDLTSKRSDRRDEALWAVLEYGDQRLRTHPIYLEATQRRKGGSLRQFPSRQKEALEDAR